MLELRGVSPCILIQEPPPAAKHAPLDASRDKNGPLGNMTAAQRPVSNEPRVDVIPTLKALIHCDVPAVSV
jgi:hypothetical protein